MIMKTSAGCRTGARGVWGRGAKILDEHEVDFRPWEFSLGMSLDMQRKNETQLREFMSRTQHLTAPHPAPPLTYLTALRLHFPSFAASSSASPATARFQEEEQLVRGKHVGPSQNWTQTVQKASNQPDMNFPPSRFITVA